MAVKSDNTKLGYTLHPNFVLLYLEYYRILLRSLIVGHS